MTTENNMWHTTEEQPNDFADIVLMNSKTGDFACFFTPFHNISFVYDKWAYLMDLVAAAKALDVAIDSLDAIQDWDADNPKEPFNLRPYQVRAIQNFARNKMKEISEIMNKGDK